MEDECWAGEHFKYAMTAAIPGLIVWGIGLPVLAFLVLYRAKQNDKLDSLHKKVTYGFLFLGYKRQYYWWELVILARKFFILMTLVWLNRISLEI